MIEPERLGYFHFWREVGTRMHIHSIPNNYNEFDRFNRDYEARNFHFTEANKRIGEATRDLFSSWFPRPFAPLVRSAVVAMLDEPLIEAFGFARPSRFMKFLVPSTVKLRGWLAGRLPARRKPRLRTESPHRSYPQGYAIDTLGPPTRPNVS